MRRLLTTTAIVMGVLYFGVPVTAHAAPLLTLSDTGTCGGACEGLTYTLESQATADPLTEQFALLITGINVSGTDTRGGRTGINAIALNLISQKPLSPDAGTMLGTLIDGVLSVPAPNFVFQHGGINSGGCNTTGEFFCFDNTDIGNGGAAPQPTTTITHGTAVLGFEATLAPGGSWADYSTALKIDWVGSANNYSLVSKDIPVNVDNCPDCIINPVIVPTPEPSSIALLGFGLLGIGAAARRTRR